MNKIVRAGFFIIITFYFMGCSESSVNESESADYSIDQVLSCFCPDGGKAVRLYVHADSIADAVFILEKRRLPKDQWKQYRTIPELFNEITKWDTSSFILKVTYDPLHKYPSYIYVNPKSIIVNDSIVGTVSDADFSYSTSNFIKYK